MRRDTQPAGQGQRRTWMAALALAAAIGISIQAAAGAYSAPLGAWPDESAHFLNGVVIHDWAHHLDELLHPVGYASNYYAHYPGFALGHWPPLFPVLESAAFSLLWIGRPVAIGLVLLTGVAFALGTFAMGDRIGHTRTAITCALLLLILPPVRDSLTIVGPDLLIAACAVWSAVSFRSLVRTSKLRYGLWFGLFASAAILSKGNGLALALLPPIYVLLARDWRLLRAGALWISLLPLMLTALPWTLATASVTAQGFARDAGIDFIIEALGLYAGRFVGLDAGPLLTALALVGIAAGFRRNADAQDRGFVLVSLALVLSFLVFHVMIPASIETRYIFPAVAGMVVLAGVGAGELLRWGSLAGHWSTLKSDSAAAVLVLLCGAVWIVPRWTLPEQWMGFDEAATVVSERGLADSTTVLVSSEASGETPFISELALNDERRPSFVVLRATKMLARTDWNLLDYQVGYDGPADIPRLLDSLQVGAIVIDDRTGMQAMQHHSDLSRLLLADTATWRLESQVGDGNGPMGGHVLIYRRVGRLPARRPPELQVKGFLIRATDCVAAPNGRPCD